MRGGVSKSSLTGFVLTFTAFAEWYAYWNAMVCRRSGNFWRRRNSAGALGCGR